MFKRKLAQAPNGQLIRPAKKKCPGCGAGEREWCKNDCTLLDPCNMARE